MISPNNPGVNGNGQVTHDGRADADHEKEVQKAGRGGDNTTSGEDKAGVNEPTPVGKV